MGSGTPPGMRRQPRRGSRQEDPAIAGAEPSTATVARELRALAIRLLARREYSRVELRARLLGGTRWQDPAVVQAAVDVVLAELRNEGLQSDGRAAEALVQSLRGRSGKRLLEHRLTSRGVDPEIAATALVAVSVDEAERAKALWERRFGTPPADVKEHARQVRFLLSRGFESGVVRQVMRGARTDNTPDHPAGSDDAADTG